MYYNLYKQFQHKRCLQPLGMAHQKHLSAKYGDNTSDNTFPENYTNIANKAKKRRLNSPLCTTFDSKNSCQFGVGITVKTRKTLCIKALRVFFFGMRGWCYDYFIRMPLSHRSFRAFSLSDIRKTFLFYTSNLNQDCGAVAQDYPHIPKRFLW